MPLLATFRNLEKIQNQKNLKKNDNQGLFFQNQIAVGHSDFNQKKPQILNKKTVLQKSNQTYNEVSKFPTSNLTELEGVIIGVKGGFEEKLAARENLKLEFLPEAKLEILSFRPNLTTLAGFREFTNNLGATLRMILSLILSFVCSFWLIYKHHPVAILSSGSFLAIPVLWTATFFNWLNFREFFGPKIKIITHQQDPLPGLASRLTFGLGTYQSCVFEYSRQFDGFKKAQVIPNPVDLNKFDLMPIDIFNFLKIKNPQTDPAQHLQKTQVITDARQIKSQLPILLIFGGGSGSLFLNRWVWANLAILSQHFRLIHLTGLLQNADNCQSEVADQHPNYLAIVSLLEEMPVALRSAHLVICRAGLASISELLYLNKPAFLVPLPDSHQEINARIVADFFPTLEQKHSQDWLSQILNWPETFQKIDYPEPMAIRISLDKYYQQIYDILA